MITEGTEYKEKCRKRSNIRRERIRRTKEDEVNKEEKLTEQEERQKVIKKMEEGEIDKCEINRSKYKADNTGRRKR